MMLYLRHHPSGRLPSGCLVQKSLVFDQRFLAGPAHRARHQFGNISFQVVVRRNANSVLHAPLLQRLIDLRFGEGGVGTKHHLLAQRLLPLNLRQEKFFLVLGTVHVSRTELRRQTVAVSIKQQQRVITHGLEVPVVGAILLFAVDRNLGRIHVQHGSVQ